MAAVWAGMVCRGETVAGMASTVVLFPDVGLQSSVIHNQEFNMIMT